jgi:hypothetical protein
MSTYARPHIDLNNNLVNPVAEAVFTEFKTVLRTKNRGARKISPRWITSSYYLNGRERGYHLDYVAARSVSFAEARSSDCIIVLYGTQAVHFEENGQLTDAAWERRQYVYFKYDEVKKAARAIFDYLVWDKPLKEEEVGGGLANWNFQVIS